MAPTTGKSMLAAAALTLLLACTTPSEAFLGAPLPAASAATVSVSTTRMAAAAATAAYVPDGLTAAQYAAIRARESGKTAGKNLGVVGVQRFQSRSMSAFVEAMEKGLDGHKFATDPRRVQSGELRPEEVPYMLRRGGKWDNSDLVGKVKGVQRKAWLQRDEWYANGGESASQSVNIFGTNVNMPWTGAEKFPYEK
jgi:hypothetical protein